MPNPFDEYINKLEGASEIDPLTVVSELREIHTQELSTREAKISKLNETIAEKDGAITKLGNDLTIQKARNFDLVDISDSNTGPNSNQSDNDDKPDGSTIKIADLFKPEVRNRHGL